MITLFTAHLNKNRWNAEHEGPDPDKGQDDFGLSDGAHGLGLHGVDDRVTPDEQKDKNYF